MKVLKHIAKYWNKGRGTGEGKKRWSRGDEGIQEVWEEDVTERCMGRVIMRCKTHIEAK